MNNTADNRNDIMTNGLLDIKHINNDLDISKDLSVNNKHAESGLLGKITHLNQSDLKDNKNDTTHHTQKGLLDV